MTGKGTITHAPDRRLRLMLAAQLLWLVLVCVLGAWWGSLVLRQAGRIAELELQLGMAVNATQSHVLHTQRMLRWESATFFSLFIASTGLLFWLYWRDARRTRGLQAFFASVTHELRTPLTSIRLQAESIAENLGANAGTQDRNLVQRILEDTLRLESQVERTLELARVEGGGPIFAQPLRLRPWIERAVVAWRDAHGERLEIRTQLDDVSILADAGAIQVILRNLIENSIRHSRREKVTITVSSEPAPDGVALRFRDDGPGYPGDPARLGALFQKGAGSQGAGVGLYLVRVLMMRMGGEARFEPGAGFSVVLRFQEGQSHGA